MSKGQVQRVYNLNTKKEGVTEEELKLDQLIEVGLATAYKQGMHRSIKKMLGTLSKARYASKEEIVGKVFLLVDILEHEKKQIEKDIAYLQQIVIFDVKEDK